jgi:EpsI family protein
MLNVSSQVRLWVTVGILLGAFVLLHTVAHGEPIVPRQPLHELPYAIGGWTAQERPFQEKVMQAVGESDYTNRVYLDRAGAPIQLYIGYYASQRSGDTIHSPKNCLPGSGWDPIKSGYTTIPIPGEHSFVVNEYVIQKDQEKQLVFYWYQGRGRLVASEYSGKFWMMADAITRNRTDGALVRVVTPMNDGEAKVHARLLGFTQIIFPNLDALIPK